MNHNSASTLNTKHSLNFYIINKKAIQDCVDIASLPKDFIDPETTCWEIRDNIVFPVG